MILYLFVIYVPYNALNLVFIVSRKTYVGNSVSKYLYKIERGHNNMYIIVYCIISEMLIFAVIINIQIV